MWKDQEKNVIKVLVEDARGHKQERFDHETLVSVIQQIGDKIMSKISEFALTQNAYNERVGKAIDGLTVDIQGLNDLITRLQNSPGEITPEDQATLDQLQASGNAVAEKAEALDGLTPPAVPTTV